MAEQRLTTLPLQGKRVLVTRTREQASALSERLRALGAIPVEFPTIRIVPPGDWSALDSARHRLFINEGTAYTWLLLTSANVVTICCACLSSAGYDSHDLQANQHITLVTS